MLGGGGAPKHPGLTPLGESRPTCLTRGSQLVYHYPAGLCEKAPFRPWSRALQPLPSAPSSTPTSPRPSPRLAGTHRHSEQQGTPLRIPLQLLGEGWAASGNTQLPGGWRGEDLTVRVLRVDCHIWLSPEFWTHLANFLPALREPWSLPAPLPSLSAKGSRPFSHIWAVPTHLLQDLLPSPDSVSLLAPSGTPHWCPGKQWSGERRGCLPAPPSLPWALASVSS